MNHFFKLLALPILALTGCFHSDPANDLHAMPPNTGFTIRTVKSGNEDHKYSLFVPRDYSPSKEYPTIVFLHGIGESGNDGKTSRTVGLGPIIAKRDGNFPFIVLFPQAGWDWTGQAQGQLVLDCLADAKRDYRIDPDHLILTGMSSGGKGTWVLGARYHDMWSCLVPMAGDSDVNDVPTLAKMHIWVLHNSGDFIVGSGNSTEMYTKIKAAGGDIRFTKYDTVGHNCWDAAYSTDELVNWMLAQKRGS